MFFLHISSPLFKNVKLHLTLDWNSTFIIRVKCILRRSSFRLSVNQSCDYAIVFGETERSHLIPRKHKENLVLTVFFCTMVLATLLDLFLLGCQQLYCSVWIYSYCTKKRSVLFVPEKISRYEYLPKENSSVFKNISCNWTLMSPYIKMNRGNRQDIFFHIKSSF